MPFLNYGNPLAALGQPQQQPMPQQNLGALGTGDYAMRQFQPSPQNGAGIMVADPNSQMLQAFWNYLYGRQIGAGNNL